MLVNKLALTPEQRKRLSSRWWSFRGGRDLLKMTLKAHEPLCDSKVDEAEKRLIDAVVRADSAEVVKLVRKKPGTLRNFAPELLIMLPELTREAAMLLLTEGFSTAAVPELFRILVAEAETPEILTDMPYRKRLMYANLLIHHLQGETVSPDEEWYPMGNTVDDGCDRRVLCRPHSYCFDPRHLYRPRGVDGEYEKPTRRIAREKVILEWKEGERTWVKDHWEYQKGCSPLCKCLELANHDLSKAMDLLHQWTHENFTPEEIGCVCTNNKYEEELEREWIEDREKLYRDKKFDRKNKTKDDD